MSAEFDFNPNHNPNFDTVALRVADASATDGDDERMWELLSLYADDEAAPDEAAVVEQMLRHDAGYARAYAFLSTERRRGAEHRRGGAARASAKRDPGKDHAARHVRAPRSPGLGRVSGASLPRLLRG